MKEQCSMCEMYNKGNEICIDLRCLVPFLSLSLSLSIFRRGEHKIL